MNLRVEVVRTNSPVLMGAVGEIIGFDYVPFGCASEKNPLCEVRFPTGYVESFHLSDLRLVP